MVFLRRWGFLVHFQNIMRKHHGFPRCWGVFLMVFLMKSTGNHGFPVKSLQKRIDTCETRQQSWDFCTIKYISGWWFGTWLDYDFPIIFGNFITPTDFHSIIFQRGRAKNHQPAINHSYQWIGSPLFQCLVSAKFPLSGP